MNKKSIVLLALAMLTACEKTPENKAQSLIKQDLKATLQSEGYEPGAFGKLDSSFIMPNKDALETNNKDLKYYTEKVEECTAHLREFLQNKISREQADYYEKLLPLLKDSAKQCIARHNELLQDATPLFSGYQMQHVYNSSNTPHQVVYYFDSSLTTILKHKELNGNQL
ncbi:hypothetical protein SAMN05421788_106357 [Filimonas lacunae]|uniref:Lipoprotein n=1 Tax=Filimonas lacunae TaxID=477680 RepID=A0A173MFT1_9BACT|nr:hypothetical protein [Filimonas lacunae]BAV06291.1 hypothetical protein FLA_2307 [Filimonas lacunae]SIT25684.1 hypothetical protein SAMN05421788_106357 [Filimonas lacunae]